MSKKISELIKCPECEAELRIYMDCEFIQDGRVKKGFVSRANKKFTNRGLTQHINAKHRNPEQTKCLKCKKTLSWKDEAPFCPKCWKIVEQEDFEAECKLHKQCELSEDEQETEDIHQAEDDAYNARFRDSRGRNVLTRR